MTDRRLVNEIQHGKFIAGSNAGNIWNWETPAGRLRWGRRVTMLTSHLKPGMKVLELGCGTGYFTKAIAKMDVMLTAIDISPELIAIARGKLKQCENVEILNGNAYQMDFDDGSFDSIIGSSVLHHLDVDKALPECYRVLRPGGVIRFTEPNMMNPQIVLQKNISYLKRKFGDSPDETAFFRWAIKRKLQYIGFSNVRVTPFDFLHPRTPKRFIPGVVHVAGWLESVPLISQVAGSLFIRAEKK